MLDMMSDVAMTQFLALIVQHDIFGLLGLAFADHLPTTLGIGVVKIEPLICLQTSGDVCHVAIFQLLPRAFEYLHNFLTHFQSSWTCLQSS